MSFSSLLINTCTIRRYTDAGPAPPYGNPIKDWDDHLTDHCRISYPRGRQVMRGTEVVPVDALLFMEKVDVTEADIAVVDGIQFEIVFVAELQDGAGGHHLELSLVRVKP